MNVWLLANVGQRDLYVDGRAPEVPKKGMSEPAGNVLPLRQLGKQILGNHEAWRGRLSAPMLESAVRHILETVSGAPLRVILFATDQADSPHRENDTIETAKVLAKWLPERLPAVASVEVRRIQDSPQDYDRMLKAFESLVPHAGGTGPNALVYVEISGGTPACNMALTLTAIRRFRERCRQIYVPQRGQLGELELGRNLLESYRAEAAGRMLDSYDFAGVADLYGDETPGRLAAYAVARGNLDLEGAEKILQQIEASAGAEGTLIEEIRKLRRQTDRLRREDKPAQLCELYWQLDIKWKRNEFADGLGRLHHLDESFLHVLVERLGVMTRKRENGADKWKDFYDSLREVGLYEIVYKKRDPEGPPTRVILRSILKHAIDQMGSGEWRGRDPGISLEDLKQAKNVLDTYDKTGDLRNNTLAGHGFTGVSRDVIEKTAGKTLENILASYATILTMVGADVRPQTNPFDDVRKLILTCITQAAGAQ
ncbi:MAG: hypothetical protein N3D11_15325 [Candidatus Sumerlaeia bacterium]|nr:hypothetical protein [Candidatus Sumerlaeia bacterium]